VLHQVRAHFGSVGAPLVGDAHYGGPALEGLDRFFLHSRSLGLEHPVAGGPVRVEAPLPPELVAALSRVGITPP
jgi:23S rRNA pseudouridine1911/1915/1917 synthase